MTEFLKALRTIGLGDNMDFEGIAKHMLAECGSEEEVRHCLDMAFESIKHVAAEVRFLAAEEAKSLLNPKR